MVQESYSKFVMILKSNGLNRFARRFNGFRFRTKSIDRNKTTQNSGVVTKVDT
ncbi:hypothetical protein CISIN_1g043904mg, partial [Citrus sinensis]